MKGVVLSTLFGLFLVGESTFETHKSRNPIHNNLSVYSMIVPGGIDKFSHATLMDSPITDKAKYLKNKSTGKNPLELPTGFAWPDWLSKLRTPLIPQLGKTEDVLKDSTVTPLPNSLPPNLLANDASKVETAGLPFTPIGGDPNDSEFQNLLKKRPLQDLLIYHYLLHNEIERRPEIAQTRLRALRADLWGDSVNAPLIDSDYVDYKEPKGKTSEGTGDIKASGDAKSTVRPATDDWVNHLDAVVSWFGNLSQGTGSGLESLLKLPQNKTN